MREWALEAIMPTVNFAHRSWAEAGLSWGYRFIPDEQIFYVISGRAELRMGDVVYPITAGEFVCYGPHAPSLLSAQEPTDYFSLHFNWHNESAEPVHPGLGLRPADPGAIYDAPPGVRLRSGQSGAAVMPVRQSVSGLEPLLTRIVREYEQALPGYTYALRGLLTQAIALMFRQVVAGARRGAEDGRIERAIQAVQNEPGVNWSVAELAAMCGYHPIHFSKLFKREMGLSPKHFIISERVRLAKAALLQGERMDSISLRLGFTSIHYFSHQFKQMTGLSPSEFRMQGKAP